MSQNKIHPDELIDTSLGSLPTLIVPDDPVNGAIEKPKSPPPSARPVPEPVVVESSIAKLIVVSPRASPPPTQLSELPKPVKSPRASTTDPPVPTSTDLPVPSQPIGSGRVNPPGTEPTTTISTSARVNPEPSTPIPTSARLNPPTTEPIPTSARINPPGTEPSTLPVPTTTTTTTDPVSSTTTPTLPPLQPTTITTSPSTLTLHSKDIKGLSKRAAALAKLDRLAGGHKSVLDADMSDIGALGIGMQLYFMLTKYLSITFFLMGIVSLPAMILHTYGNGVSDNAANPGGFAYTMLGNEGIHPDFINTTMCYPNKAGIMDCTWNTIETPFTSDPITASWIITISDVLYSFIFLIFFLVYRYQAKKAIEIHMNENLTPAKYAVYVRGLPPDATEKEILDHFNQLYDLSRVEEYHPLWIHCCWGKRRKVIHSLSRHASNRNVVQNVDHLAGTTSLTKDLYLGTWIAEVSLGHPTGGLLKTFLSMERLTQKIAETNELITILQQEQSYASTLDFHIKANRKWKFTKRDLQLLHKAQHQLQHLEKELNKKTSKISMLKEATDTKKKKKKSTMHAFDWDACECAFVVFNNLESRRRCLQDYRKCTSFLPHYFQPTELRFRKVHRLRVVAAPEPSNILWENLEITDRGRFYRRSFTNFITFLLLLLSCAIISAAQSAQKVMKEKMVGTDFCSTTLPMVYYGNETFDQNVPNRFPRRLEWHLEWNNATICSPGTQNEVRYAIGYNQSQVYPLAENTTVILPLPMTWKPKLGPNHPDRYQLPTRCIDPCISESSNRTCSTVGCWNVRIHEDVESCGAYPETNILYCFCKEKVTQSVQQYGIWDGPQRLWKDYIPCQGFIKGYLTQTITIYSAAAVVVVVNILLKTVLRAFATFEAHSSESAKATTIAAKMFCTQFLNTAVIVLIVNAYLGVDNLPLLSDLFRGDLHDFDREWYPTVGLGITMTMVMNAFLPQFLLFLQIMVISPLTTCWKRQFLRTQAQMNKLYGGPTFDISVRYPLVLNSLCVTMAFSGGIPILLFIGAFTAFGTYWFDKLSILHLYSIKTAYDEELGELALGIVPWTLVVHLALSLWMYGNTQVMKSSTLDIQTLVQMFPVENTNTTSGTVDTVLTSISRFDRLGLVSKIIHKNVMMVFIVLLLLILCLLLSSVMSQLIWPVMKRTIGVLIHNLWLQHSRKRQQKRASVKIHAENTVTTTLQDPTTSIPSSNTAKSESDSGECTIPEYTDYFIKSISSKFVPDKQLGFEKNSKGHLVRRWREETIRNGIKREAGESMRTWEAMQAPVKTYAIEMNDKYKLAVAEIVAAAKRIKAAKGEVVPTIVQASSVEAALMATEPVSIVVVPTEKKEASPVIPDTSPNPSNPDSSLKDPEVSPRVGVEVKTNPDVSLNPGEEVKSTPSNPDVTPSPVVSLNPEVASSPRVEVKTNVSSPSNPDVIPNPDVNLKSPDVHPVVDSKTTQETVSTATVPSLRLVPVATIPTTTPPLATPDTTTSSISSDMNS